MKDLIILTFYLHDLKVIFDRKHRRKASKDLGHRNHRRN
jgi:hypothetical protein